MSTQPEAILESNLIQQLQGLGYEGVQIEHEADLVANLKKQIERHNKLYLTEGGFEKFRVRQDLEYESDFDREVKKVLEETGGE